MPPKADKLLFSLAPMLAMIPVLALVAVIPFGDTIVPESIVRTSARTARSTPRWPNGACAAGYAPSRAGRRSRGTASRTRLRRSRSQIAPLNVGILYVFAMAGQGIVGAAIAGWSSDNKFSLMGALRAASQMVSYEVTMGLTLIGAMMIYGIGPPRRHGPLAGRERVGHLRPAARVLPLLRGGRSPRRKRIPFDLPEAESELVVRLLHRVLGHEVRHVLLRRVHGGRHELDAPRHDLPRRLAAPVPPPRRPHDRVRRHAMLFARAHAAHLGDVIFGVARLLREDARRSAGSRPSSAGACRASATTS